jgi:cell wall-associated NlpC family hydrolase
MEFCSGCIALMMRLPFGVRPRVSAGQSDWTRMTRDLPSEQQVLCKSGSMASVVLCDECTYRTWEGKLVMQQIERFMANSGTVHGLG